MERLHPPAIADKSKQLAELSVNILNRGRHLGLIDDCNGDLPSVLNRLANATFALGQTAPEHILELQAQIAEFAEFYNSEEIQEIIPFFGIGVSETDTGRLIVSFAD